MFIRDRNERALHGRFAGAGNLLTVLSAAVKVKPLTRMPLTNRGNLFVGDDKPRAEGVRCQSCM